jgi:hypothetical protein
MSEIEIPKKPLLKKLKDSVQEESAQGDAFAAEEELDSVSGGTVQPVLDACSCWCTGSGDISQCPGCGPG